MATSCDACGVRTNEVKSGAGIEPQGVHIEVEVRRKEDLTRDVLKVGFINDFWEFYLGLLLQSDTCDLEIPQLELTVGPHALGGRFTTIEGLITAMKDQLNDPATSHIFGDSKQDKTKEQFEHFLRKLDDVLENKTVATVVLDDPCGNSYIQVRGRHV